MYLKKYNLKGKYSLVTGAGKGLGRACAIALAEAGSNLILISRTQKDLDSVSKIAKKYKWIGWLGLLAILLVAIDLIYTDLKLIL